MSRTIIATLNIKEGSEAEFEAAAREMMDAVAANEPGCLLYELSRSDDPQVYFFMERYTDDDAVAAHGGTDHMKAFGARIGDCLAGRPTIVRGAPVVEG